MSRWSSWRDKANPVRVANEVTGGALGSVGSKLGAPIKRANEKISAEATRALGESGGQIIDAANPLKIGEEQAAFVEAIGSGDGSNLGTAIEDAARAREDALRGTALGVNDAVRNADHNIIEKAEQAAEGTLGKWGVSDQFIDQTAQRAHGRTDYVMDDADLMARADYNPNTGETSGMFNRDERVEATRDNAEAVGIHNLVSKGIASIGGPVGWVGAGVNALINARLNEAGMRSESDAWKDAASGAAAAYMAGKDFGPMDNANVGPVTPVDTAVNAGVNTGVRAVVPVAINEGNSEQYAGAVGAGLAAGASGAGNYTGNQYLTDVANSGINTAIQSEVSGDTATSEDYTQNALTALTNRASSNIANATAEQTGLGQTGQKVVASALGAELAGGDAGQAAINALPGANLYNAASNVYQALQQPSGPPRTADGKLDLGAMTPDQKKQLMLALANRRRAA